jgi:hypothetical protein
MNWPLPSSMLQPLFPTPPRVRRYRLHFFRKRAFSPFQFGTENKRRTLLGMHGLKVVTSEKIGGSGVISTLGTCYGGVVMGVILPFNEAAILYV